LTVVCQSCVCANRGMFAIRFAEGDEEDLRKIRVFYRNQILDAIEEQLVHEPDIRTKNRKLLENLLPSSQRVTPVWELRVGEYRIFYDCSPARAAVSVLAIRRKRRGAKTEEIL
jgi:mRNA-degrading endonuclease RelE of RelBE toxin-antitoxin system